jgi:hypothetical protein
VSADLVSLSTSHCWNADRPLAALPAPAAPRAAKQSWRRWVAVLMRQPAFARLGAVLGAALCGAAQLLGSSDADASIDGLLAAIDKDSDGSYSRDEVAALLDHFSLKQPDCPNEVGRASPYCRPAAPVGEDEEEGCLYGWAGDDCDQCDVGFGGELCAPLAAATVDQNGGDEDGCLEGWTGEDCDECAHGYAGDECLAIGSEPPKAVESSGADSSEQVAQQPSGKVRTVEFPHSTPVFIDDNEPPPTWDPNGYLLAHFCQGRFGNQFDYLLHLLDLAGRTGRTLILPPYTDYSAQETMGKYPWFWWFGEIFDTDHLQQHIGFKVIDLGEFMVHFRERWEAAGLVGHCTYPKNRMDGWHDNCMIDISPKKPFWRNLGVEFERSDVLLTASHRMIKKVEHPVVALDCAPGKYPAPAHLDKNAAALNWSLPIRREAEAFIDANLERPYVAVHIRQAFFPACDGRPMTHSSGQCRSWLESEGHEFPDATPSFPNEICHPSGESMHEQLSVLMDATGAKSLFVASDNPIGANRMRTKMPLSLLVPFLRSAITSRRRTERLFAKTGSGQARERKENSPNKTRRFVLRAGTEDLRFLRSEFGAKTLQGGLRDSASGFLRPQVRYRL